MSLQSATGESVQQSSSSNESMEGSLSPEVMAAQAAAQAMSEAEEGLSHDSKERPQDSSQAKQSEEQAVKEELGGLAKKLKERERVQQERLRHKEEADLILRDARAEQEKLNAERERVIQAAQLVEELQRNPLKAIKAAGWDPEELLLAIVEEAEGKRAASKAPSETDLRLAKLEEELKRRDELENRRRQEFLAKKEQEHIQGAIEGFTRVAMDEDKFPTLAGMYESDVSKLIAEADEVAIRCAQKGLQVSFEDIAEYLEEQAIARLEAANRKRGAKQEKAQAQSYISPLSARDRSERRGFVDERALEDEERIQLAVQAAINANVRTK